jgi:hypothetical protein
VSSLLTHQFIQDIDEDLKGYGYKPSKYYYMHN